MFKIFENTYYFIVKISENLEIPVPISVETQLQIDLETIIDVPHHLWQFLSHQQPSAFQVSPTVCRIFMVLNPYGTG